MNLKNFKSGLSIADVLVTLAIIGVLATVSMSMLRINRPNAELMLFRKVYAQVTSAINDIINDEDLYPPEQTTLTKEKTSDVEYTAEQFINILAARLGTNSENVSPKKDSWASFTTPDGMAFKMYPDAECLQDGCILYVDINGRDKGQNCSASTSRYCYNLNFDSTCTRPDVFKIKINNNGKVSVNRMEAVYLYTNEPTKKYKDLLFDCKNED